MDTPSAYDAYIVQSLIGNYKWSSHEEAGRYFHVGTVPNKHSLTFVADLRMMVCSGPDGFTPLALYARRAANPLSEQLGNHSSWEMLGTNLSVKQQDGWSSDTNRLMLMDERDFNRLGLGIDDLINAYIQTVLSVLAVDRMAGNLVSSKGGLKKKLFRSLNDDVALLNEVSGA